MKKLLLAAAVLLTISVQAQTSVVKWDGPLIITEPGTYNLHNQGTATQKAVEVYGSAKEVTLTGYVDAVDGNNGIHINGNVRANLTKLKITHSSTGANVQPGMAIFAYQPRKLIVDHCELYDQNGIIIQGSDQYVRDSIIIRYSTADNVTKVKPDGTIGGNHTHFVLWDGVQNYPSIQMYGCRYIGKAGSACEDIVNFKDSWTSTGSNPDIYGNLLSGALIFPITSADNYSGSGFTIEGESKRVRFHNNTVLDCENALWNMSEPGPGSQDNLIYANYGVSAGIPRGAETLKPYQYWAGCSIYMFAADSGRGNKIYGNTLGYVSNRLLSHFFPMIGRQDEGNYPGTLLRIPQQNRMPAGMNYYLAYKPTKATEDSAIKRWDDSLSKAGQYVGITPLPASKSTGAISLNQFDSLAVTGTPVDTAKEQARYTAGTFHYSSSDSTILAVVQSAPETSAKLYGRKVGKATVTASLTTERGNPFQKSFDVEVLYLYPEPVDITFTFSKPGQ